MEEQIISKQRVTDHGEVLTGKREVNAMLDPVKLGAMKVKYDQEVDVLTIQLSGASVEESDEDKPGVILDYDKDGNIVGIEILNASKRMENPRALEYAVA